MKYIMLSTAAILLVGCSNKQIYTAIQENRRQECAKLPQAQYEKCMSEHDTSYEKYERGQPSTINREAAQ